MTDELDSTQALKALDRAIQLQARSVVAMSHLAGALRGLGGVAIKDQLRRFVVAEVEDTYLLVEKFSALGGRTTVRVGDVDVMPEVGPALEELIAHERAVIAALHEVIPHTGQQPYSEALEHLLEHLIMRKQQQVDFLWHATESEPYTR